MQAWKELPEKELLICGSGPEEEWIRKYLEENHMEQVKLMGQLPHEKVLKLLAQSKALVLPTLWYEGQPMVILESYAVGTPVLVSNIGNTGNMLITGVTGIRFIPGNPEDLKRAVRELEKTEQWSTESVYEKLYTPERSYEKLKQIYDYTEETLA